MTLMDHPADTGEGALAPEAPLVEVVSAREVGDDDVDDGAADDRDGVDDCHGDEDGVDDDGQARNDRDQRILELAPTVLRLFLRSTGQLAVLLQHIKEHQLYKPKYKTMAAYAEKELGLEAHVLKVALRAGRVAWSSFRSDANDILAGLLRGAPLGSIPELPNQTKLVALGNALKVAPRCRHAELVEKTRTGRCTVKDLESLTKKGAPASKHQAEPRPSRPSVPSSMNASGSHPWVAPQGGWQSAGPTSPALSPMMSTPPSAAAGPTLPVGDNARTAPVIAPLPVGTYGPQVFLTPAVSAVGFGVTRPAQAQEAVEPVHPVEFAIQYMRAAIKVLEEASPTLPTELRDRMNEVATQLGAAMRHWL